MPFDRTVRRNPELGLPVRIRQHASQPAQGAGGEKSASGRGAQAENKLLQPCLIFQSRLERLSRWRQPPRTVHVGPETRECSE